MNPTPRGRDVALEEIRIVGLSLRIVALVAAVVIGIVTVVIAIDIVRGNAETWFDGDPSIPISLASFLFPFAVWRGQRRFGPAFLWTLPVDRRRLALAKVLAGWVWLMTALIALVLWRLGLALLAGATVMLFSFIGATALYLLGSALVLGLRHPLRWLLGTASLFFLIGFLNNALGDRFVSSPRLPPAAERAIAVWPFLCLACGAIALWAALSRQKETR
jgi:hypothetical protein